MLTFPDISVYKQRTLNDGMFHGRRASRLGLCLNTYSVYQSAMICTELSGKNIYLMDVPIDR